jgi:hypothetical protein
MKAIFLTLAILLFTQPVSAEIKSLGFCKEIIHEITKTQQIHLKTLIALRNETKKKSPEKAAVGVYMKRLGSTFEKLKHFAPVYSAYCR